VLHAVRVYKAPPQKSQVGVTLGRAKAKELLKAQTAEMRMLAEVGKAQKVVTIVVTTKMSIKGLDATHKRLKVGELRVINTSAA
jgi:hypothetical protein